MLQPLLIGEARLYFDIVAKALVKLRPLNPVIIWNEHLKHHYLGRTYVQVVCW